jgi:hypothetical protein
MWVYSEKTLFTVTTSITNPMWPELATGRRTGKLVNNLSNYDTAQLFIMSYLFPLLSLTSPSSVCFYVILFSP